MQYKKTISVQESVDFCNSVISTATVDGHYVPSLFEYSVRVNAILYFSDYEFAQKESGIIDQDEACLVAFETTYYNDIFTQSIQLQSLIGACKEQLRINHDILIASLHPEDQFKRLVDMLEGVLGNASEIANNLDPAMIGKIVERLGSVDDKSIIAAVTETQKPKRGRKPGSKNKPKDNLVHIPGQLAGEDYTDEVIDTTAK